MVRHLITVDDFSESEITAIFALADEYLERLAPPGRPHCVRGRLNDADQFILATLFYEASTRTRFSFESAMARLGGQVLSSADWKTTSAAKGESLADTIRVVQSYADVIVMRHPNEGAVRVAADFAEIPVINAGDGGHEHPTQTLCDLYTLQREKGNLKNLNVALWGDLKNGRTVHSLVYGLARFGARIIPMAAEGFELPDHVIRRLVKDYDCQPFTVEEVGRKQQAELPVDVVYVTPEKPHSQTLYTNPQKDCVGTLREQFTSAELNRIDALYVTRLQKERLDDSSSQRDYQVVDAEFVKSRLDEHSRVMHPLPRVNELGYDIDNDERAVYFKQAAYGVPVRMALLAAMLRVRRDLLAKLAPRKKYAIYQPGNIRCQNPACITRHEAEMRYLLPKFWILSEGEQLLLRCAYCESEWFPPWVGHLGQRAYQTNAGAATGIGGAAGAVSIRPEELIVFPDEAAARSIGFQPHAVVASV